MVAKTLDQRNEPMTKHMIAGALALTLSTGAVFAGGFDDPIVEEDVIIEETSSSDGGILIPLLFLVFGAAALSS
jgi:hypothetical protein